MALTASGEIQLLPAGAFRTVDGRPKNAPHYRIDAAIAAKVIALAAERHDPFVTDYEHQTLLAKENGQPAPAAGWFKKLEWREGVGLFAVDVEWTDRARAMIEAGEYKFVSPVIAYDKTGAVTALLMAAITNYPAIDGMDQLQIAAASLSLAQLTQETPMNEELLEQLRWLLNMPVGATAEEILAQLQKLADQIKQGQDATAAASCDLVALFTAQRTEISALKSAAPDPAKFVAVGVVQDLQTQVSALSGELAKIKVDEVVTAALSSGRLLPAMEAWAREFGAKDLAALSAYLKNAPVIVAPGSTQTGGKSPEGAGTNVAALTADQVKLCEQMRISPEDFQKTLSAAESA